MRVAVFTPTHNPTRLIHAARSLAAQVVDAPISWWIGVNGPAAIDPGMLVIADDALRIAESAGVVVHLVDISSHGPAIGALKRALCDNAIEDGADVVVELDHDDVLDPRAIASIVATPFDPGDRVFWYSDFAEFRDGTNAPHAYSAEFGWSSYPVVADAPGTDVHGAVLLASRAPTADARSMCQILYAPNHLRAWSAAAYIAAGGHSPSLDVCDDHDLMIRTYLDVGTRFVHLPECLYYYRLGANTCAGTANAKIQALSGQGTARYLDGAAVPDFAQPIGLRDMHLHRLVEAEAKRRGGRLVDIGGAISCPAGWTSLDVVGGDISCDVRDGLPFADSSVFAIRAFDMLEHLQPGDAARFIAECWRVLVPGGWLLTQTPADNGVGAACDLSHVSRWNTRTWAYFWSGRLRPYRDQAFPGLRADFQPVRVFEQSITAGPWPCQWTIPYVIADLVAVKDGHRPAGAIYL